MGARDALVTGADVLSTLRIVLAFVIAAAATAFAAGTAAFTPDASAVALLAFLFAVATDIVGGRLARGHETLHGSVLDSLADKALVYAVLVPFTQAFSLPLLLPLIARDAVAVGLRLVAAWQGTALRAGRLGRLKTAALYVACAAALTLAWLQSGSALVPRAVAVDAGDLGKILLYLAVSLLAIAAGTWLSFVTLFRYIVTVRSIRQRRELAG